MMSNFIWEKVCTTEASHRQHRVAEVAGRQSGRRLSYAGCRGGGITLLRLYHGLPHHTFQVSVGLAGKCK